ncbi:MAG: UDP-N-acetylglucosamine--N-acetylmuramyl-(pentapeptide) pyrophosphoryl-undecaprenol N-acetylglucosamine transferase [Candidatus Yanofskybacteria bacterium]|nr:UDP-N-acetylglucosamine--N-acetylmuramyl-(pentapeptide) pyrophosphoryl-undecaprenol N-acetylglucosamine transferase [Candidatus Yanofskybacteria bacterium]
MAHRVLLVGGGTGGHVYPLVAVARALKDEAAKTGVSLELLMMGDGPVFERAARENGIRYATIIAPKLRRYASIGNVLDVFKVPFALLQSFIRLLFFMPDAVFAKGGYTCVFPVLAARFYFIPVYLHESDSIPGLANRMLARRSTLVFTAFASADQAFGALGRPTALVGNPFRAHLCTTDRVAAHTALKLDPAKKTMLIIGGSLGAVQLNDLVLEGLVRLVQKGYQVIHQTGEKNFAEVKKAVEQYMAEGATTYAPLIAAQYRVYPFLDESELAAAYGAADIAVTRASASVLTELACARKPMIVVPLPGSANDHQQANAAELAKYGAVVMDGANVSVQVLMAQVERMLEPTTYADLSNRIAAFAKPDAAAAIARVLLARP